MQRGCHYSLDISIKEIPIYLIQKEMIHHIIELSVLNIDRSQCDEALPVHLRGYFISNICHQLLRNNSELCADASMLCRIQLEGTVSQ